MKTGKKLVNVLSFYSKNQKEKLNEENSNLIPYNQVEDFLKPKPYIQPSMAMKEYSLKRSFSEKLEQKKHSNLNSFFAVILK
jgi:hypothetical protein